MKRVLFSVCLVAALLAGGCGVSINPIYDAETLADPAPVAGVWRNDAYVVRVTPREQSRLFDVQVIDRTEDQLRSAALTGGLVEIGDTMYLDLMVNMDESKDVMPKLSPAVLFHWLPIHSIAKVYVDAETMSLDFMHPTGLKQWVLQHRDAVDHAVQVIPGDDGAMSQSAVVLTATPTALRAFLKEHGDEKIWFSFDEHAKPQNFQRGNEAEFNTLRDRAQR